MVSYYNSLAMFPNHYSHHHQAYFSYPAPYTQHQLPPQHAHYAANPFTVAAAAAQTNVKGTLGELSACNGGPGGGSSSLGLTPAPGLENPCSSPPSSASLHQQGAGGFSQQKFSDGLSGMGSSPPASCTPAPWHNPTRPPLYRSSCDDWPSSAQASHPPPPPLFGPASPAGSYKLSSTAVEFQQQSWPPPPAARPQQPQGLGGHSSPDSGLASSSDGVSSSPQLPPVPHHHTAVRPPNPRSPYEWIRKPSYQSNTGKTRTEGKYRAVYSNHQRLELEKEFQYNRYISNRWKSQLAATLGLSHRQVKVWFQNRRAKDRKQVKKREKMIQKEKMDDVAVQM